MNSRGQALIEYLLIIVIISIIIIGIVIFYRGQIKDIITKTTCSLVNGSYVEGNESGQGKCDKNES